MTHFLIYALLAALAVWAWARAVLAVCEAMALWRIAMPRSPLNRRLGNVRLN